MLEERGQESREEKAKLAIYQRLGRVGLYLFHMLSPDLQPLLQHILPIQGIAAPHLHWQNVLLTMSPVTLTLQLCSPSYLTNSVLTHVFLLMFSDKRITFISVEKAFLRENNSTMEVVLIYK